MNSANAGTYPSTTGGMTSGRTMLRDFRRSSMGDMSCFLPGLRHDDKESIYVLRRIEEMWSDSNFAFTQGNQEHRAERLAADLPADSPPGVVRRNSQSGLGCDHGSAPDSHPAQTSQTL